MINLEIRYSEGLRVEFPVLPKGLEVYERWLFSDVQTVETASLFIQGAERIIDGRQGILELDGNEYLVTLKKEGAKVENLYVEECGPCISLKDLVSIVDQWRNYLPSTSV